MDLALEVVDNNYHHHEKCLSRPLYQLNKNHVVCDNFYDLFWDVLVDQDQLDSRLT